MHSTDQSPGPGHRVKQHSSTLRVGRQLQKSEHCTGVTGQRVKMHARCTLCNVHIFLTVILLLELAQKKSSGKNKMCTCVCVCEVASIVTNSLRPYGP